MDGEAQRDETWDDEPERHVCRAEPRVYAEQTISYIGKQAHALPCCPRRKLTGHSWMEPSEIFERLGPLTRTKTTIGKANVWNDPDRVLVGIDLDFARRAMPERQVIVGDEAHLACQVMKRVVFKSRTNNIPAPQFKKQAIAWGSDTRAIAETPAAHSARPHTERHP